MEEAAMVHAALGWGYEVCGLHMYVEMILVKQFMPRSKSGACNHISRDTTLFGYQRFLLKLE